MKIIVPDYYKEFKCIADKCQHTCCKGWEVEIDDVSLERYSDIAYINEKIERTDDNHFKLIEDEKCPFLLESGLCDMIVIYGEEMICQTCADHPRYRNFWTDRIEMGLGLVCEEAARIILSRETPMRLVVLSDEKDLCESSYADNVAADNVTADNVTSDNVTAADDATDDGAEHDVQVDASELPEDEAWLMELRDNMLCEVDSIETEHPMRRLREYLIYRHIPDALYDDRLEERIAFIDRFMELVKSSFDESDGSFDSLVDIVRQYSYDIEYDEEVKERYLESSE